MTIMHIKHKEVKMGERHQTSSTFHKIDKFSFTCPLHKGYVYSPTLTVSQVYGVC